MPSGRKTRRGAILLAAEKLLKHYGFAKTTVADIAREARVSVGSVYLEFASKDDIAAALAAEVQEQLLSAMETARTSAQEAAEQLRALLLARARYLQRLAQQGQHGADLVQCACPAVQQVRERFHQRQQQLLALLLAEAQRQGEFCRADPALTAELLLGICDALLPGCAHRVAPRQLQRDLETLCQLLLHGLLAR